MVGIMSEPAAENGPRESAAAGSPEHVLLSWRSIPARRALRTTILVSAVVLGVPVMLAVWYGPFYGVLGIMILGGSLLSFFLPSDYILTDQNITRRYLGISQTRAWAEFRSYYPDKNGVLLSPFALPSRLENFRGMYLRFEGNRELVLAAVSGKIMPPSAEGAG
jgi:hypothetical protein